MLLAGAWWDRGLLILVWPLFYVDIHIHVRMPLYFLFVCIDVEAEVIQ